MKIDDLLSLAGEHALESFEWGVRVVDVVNFHSPDVNYRIDAEMSGRVARAIVRSLPASKLFELLSLEIDPVTGVLKEPAPVVETMPFNLPSVAPEPFPVFAGPAVPEVVTPPVQQRTGRNPLLLLIGGTIVLIALVLVTVISVVSLRTGTMQDTSGLTGVTGAMTEVFKALLDNEIQQQEKGGGSGGAGSQDAPLGPHDPSF